MSEKEMTAEYLLGKAAVWGFTPRYLRMVLVDIGVTIQKLTDDECLALAKQTVYSSEEIRRVFRAPERKYSSPPELAAPYGDIEPETPDYAGECPIPGYKSVTFSVEQIKALCEGLSEFSGRFDVRVIDPNGHEPEPDTVDD